MRNLGSALMVLGLLVGAALAVAMTAGVTIPGVSWIIMVGLVKLTILGAVGLISVGATLRRLASRSEERNRLADSHDERSPS